MKTDAVAAEQTVRTDESSAAHWLDGLPDGWVAKKIGYAARLASGHTPNRQNPEYRTDCFVPWISLGDVSKFRDDRVKFIEETEEKISALGLANSSATLLPEGTVVLSRTASVGFSVIMGKQMATTQDFANWVCGTDLLPEFLLYALRAMRPDFLRLKMGSTHSTIYMPDIKSLRLAVPSVPLQQRVVDFLDAETARIDTLIDKQQKLIELLKEKRQTVILQAVTRGLDPNVPMKDSGVEWLGEVLAHWHAVPLKWKIVSLDQGWSPQCEARVPDAAEYGVLKVGAVNGGEFRKSESKALPSSEPPRLQYLVRREDLLVSRANTRDLVGSAAVVPADSDNIMLRDKLYRIRLSSKLSPWFVSYYLGTKLVRNQIELDASGASASMLNIGQDTLRSLPVPIPSCEEQQRIVSFIDRALKRLAASERIAMKAIELLEERRTALITAAVTGQIDVTDHAATIETTAA